MAIDRPRFTTLPRVLFITETIPFPPRNGKELPASHLLKGFAERFECDLAVLSRDPKEFVTRRSFVPATVRNVYEVKTKGRSRLDRIFKEITLRAPAFVDGNFEVDELPDRLRYDLVWVSPIGGMGFVNWCHGRGLLKAAAIGIGLNDVKSTLYLDSVRELGAGWRAWTLGRVGRLLRLPLIYVHERRILKRAAVVHVQTDLERVRACRILASPNGPRIVAAQNGRKERLFEAGYRGRDSKRILFMTHLAGGRSRESEWFLDDVWPMIRRSDPGADLILVGTPPEPGSALLESLPPGVEVLGYADDLVGLYDSVALSVVPIFHSTGIINRVLDALCAGVPVVARSAPLRTVPGLVPGRHAIAADDARNFAGAVIALLGDRHERERISADGRALARTQPTWADTVARVCDAVEREIGTAISS